MGDATWRSSAEVLGVPADVLASELARQPVAQVVSRGARRGPLALVIFSTLSN